MSILPAKFVFHIFGRLLLITLPLYLVIKRYWLYRRSKKMTWQFLALHSDGLSRKRLQSSAIMSVSWSFLLLKLLKWQQIQKGMSKCSMCVQGSMWGYFPGWKSGKSGKFSKCAEICSAPATCATIRKPLTEFNFFRPPEPLNFKSHLFADYLRAK